MITVHCTVEKTYEIRPVAWLLVVRHVFLIFLPQWEGSAVTCKSRRRKKEQKTSCRLLKKTVWYSKIYPHRISEAYILYIIQCRPHKMATVFTNQVLELLRQKKRLDLPMSFFNFSSKKSLNSAADKFKYRVGTSLLCNK